MLTDTVRRFELPDLDRHGKWIIKRVTQAYPHLNERQVAGWLRGLIYSQEFLFLYQPNSAALAQSVHPDVLTPQVVIWERFVWAANPKNPDHIKEASLFYERFRKWAQNKDCGMMVVNEQTDVPADEIEEILGPMMVRKQSFVRL